MTCTVLGVDVLCASRGSSVEMSWHPFHVQCPPYVWLAGPWQQTASASRFSQSCRGGTVEKTELHLSLSDLAFPLFPSFLGAATHTHSVALNHLLYKWVTLPRSAKDWKQGPLGDAVVSGWLSVCSCVRMGVSWVFVNHTGVLCLITNPLPWTNKT